MTEALYRSDAYARDAAARVMRVTEEGGLVLDRTVFYPTGGGQPGDSGKLTWPGGEIEIATAVKGEGEEIVLLPAEPAPLPSEGARVDQELDWDRRHRHMRVHTALHLLSVVIPLPVTGGSIGSEKGRLDFDMPEAPEDKAELDETLNRLIACDFPVTEEWITEAELDANPGLVKTMSVQPPRGAGRIRLVRIGLGGETVDLQPCGGTHVATTAEIGRVRLGKIEKKGKQNRRVTLLLD
ncbi:alanyl-tRNA editing protein [Histidinibacterium aquaticum]|uniref:Alanine--tRNA ligase n=1 Tax=Histidinibacterium aquaticum TaxID=2613962 RepID=A0A5J5GNU6_9RHOB|nr:alanyl-tRNA editing protein [Histidinibacterium aquaticum]KAA9009820.1 alanyl-tRNA editing protein [Histidinibacterium aquaticum]